MHTYSWTTPLLLNRPPERNISLTPSIQLWRYLFVYLDLIIFSPFFLFVGQCLNWHYRMGRCGFVISWIRMLIGHRMETCSLLVVPLRSDTISPSVTDRSKCIRELTRNGLRGMYNCAGAPAFEGDGACYILGVHVMKGAE